MVRRPTLSCRRRSLAGLAAGAAALVALGPAAGLAMRPGVPGLILIVKDIRSPFGRVHVGVFDDPEAFPRGETAVGERVAARTGRVMVRFPDLPAGRYAFAFYHDENGNEQFDKTLLGLPVEGFGFSNDAPLSLGPPSFEAAAVDFDGGSLTIIASMRYF